jgi:hypothetical protein
MHGDLSEMASVRVIDSLEPLPYRRLLSGRSHDHGDSVHRLYRYVRTTAAAIARWYGPIALRKARIRQSE